MPDKAPEEIGQISSRVGVDWSFSLSEPVAMTEEDGIGNPLHAGFVDQAAPPPRRILWYINPPEDRLVQSEVFWNRSLFCQVALALKQ